MSADPFHLNRPVHLALRDAFYEQAVLQAKKLSEKKVLSEQRETAEKALRFFCEAKVHAEAANRSEKTSTEDQSFLEVLDTAVDNAQSIARMLRRQQSSKEKECRICRFLGSNEVHQKMSTHYRRCAAYILKGMLLLLQHADRPYQDLQQAGVAKMSPSDQARYEKARALRVQPQKT